MKSQPFISEFKLKSFSDYDEAKNYAITTYESLQDGSLGTYGINEIEEMNWFYKRYPVQRDPEPTVCEIEDQECTNYFNMDRTKEMGCNQASNAEPARPMIHPFTICPFTVGIK